MLFVDIWLIAANLTVSPYILIVRALNEWYEQVAAQKHNLSHDNEDVTEEVPSLTQIAKFMGPTWGPPGSCRLQMGPMLAPWTLLSGNTL